MRVYDSLPNYYAMYQKKGIKESAESQSFAEEMKETEEMKEAEEVKDAERVKEESKSDTEIITRPDGSKVLMITNQIGGMQTVTSIKLSQANPFQNDHKELPDVSETAKAADGEEYGSY